LTLLRLRPILHSKVEKKVKEESMPLTIVEIEKDPYYKKGVRRGVKVGLKRGIERGLKRGIERGIERGLKQGIELGIKQGIERGRREGEYRKAIETARKLYKMGLSLEKISEAVNLPLDEVKKMLLK